MKEFTFIVRLRSNCCFKLFYYDFLMIIYFFFFRFISFCFVSFLRFPENLEFVRFLVRKFDLLHSFCFSFVSFYFASYLPFFPYILRRYSLWFFRRRWQPACSRETQWDDDGLSASLSNGNWRRGMSCSWHMSFSSRLPTAWTLSKDGVSWVCLTTSLIERKKGGDNRNGKRAEF